MDTPQAPLAALDVVLCRAGVWPVGIEAGQIGGSRRCEPADAATPALAALLDLPGGDSGDRQVLALKASGGEIRVAGPVELRALPAACIHPLPPLLAARCRLPGLRAVALEHGRLVLLIDLSDLPPR